MTESVRLEPGQTAPDFTLKDQEGNSVSLSSYRGKKVVLYFYPAAMTPACTTQSCDFEDNLASLAAAGYQVLGVSKDDVTTLAEFATQDSLTFPLLSDEDLTVHKLYGAWGDKNSYGRIVTGTLRSTFVIDEDGRITHTFYNTKATGHVAMLRKRLKVAAS